MMVPMTYHHINGVDLYSEVAGDGDPVLLLHGGFCSLESLRAQSDALVEEYRVYAFERPGHGRSADTDGEYSYARGVADTLAYLDATGLESAHIVGYSDGAIIGLLLALDHPARVRSLVAISANLDPSAFADPTPPNSPATEPTQLDLSQPDPSQAGPSQPGSRGWAAPVLAPLPESQPPIPKPDAERMHYERLSPDGAEHADVVLAKLFRLWTREPHIDPADLARVTAPTLVMSGDRDTIRPDHSLLIAASIPGAQLCIVPGTSHALVAERPALISTLIREFLRAQ